MRFFSKDKKKAIKIRHLFTVICLLLSVIWYLFTGVYILAVSDSVNIGQQVIYCNFNGICEPRDGENVVNCFSDCGGGGSPPLLPPPPPPPSCGDSSCNGDETCVTCPSDCGICPLFCGDSNCNGDETCVTCPFDCGTCPPTCGDNKCNGDETCVTCPFDCGTCPPTCGDNKCNGDETCVTCPSDCGICPLFCGDSNCNGDETCVTCPFDCGTCPPTCGDNKCNGDETCVTCPSDCGTCPLPPALYCGNNICDNNETCETCPSDCGICAVEKIKEAGKQVLEKTTQVVKSVAKTIENIRENPTVKKIIEEPAVDVVTKTISAVAVATAAATGLSGLMPSATAVVDFAYLPVRLLTVLGYGLGFMRRRKEWGVVYDSVTKQPLDPVAITLKDKNGKEIKSVITDINGRFGFLVPPGQYSLEAKKTHYRFPAQKVLTDKDEIYDNIYKGGLLNLADTSMVAVNIAMDPVGFDWNEIAKKNYIKFNYSKERIKRFMPDFLFIFGFIISGLFLVIKPTLLNKIIVIIFVVLWGLRRLGFHRRIWGMILKKEAGGKKPLSFAILRLFYKGTTAPQIAHAVADVNGRYYSLIEPETYDIIIEEKKETEYEFAKKIPSVKIKKKALNNDFEI